MKTLIILLSIFIILTIAGFILDNLAKKNDNWEFLNVLVQVTCIFYTFGTLWYIFG